MSELIVALVAILVGITLGGIAVWQIQKTRRLQLDEKLNNLLSETNELKIINARLTEDKYATQAQLLKTEALYEQSKNKLAETNHELQQKVLDLNRTSEEKAVLYEKLKQTREKLDNQQNDILRLREQFRLEFSELAQKILDDNSTKLLQTNEQNMQQLLSPLKANITEFKQKVEETYDKEAKERFSLAREVHRLIEMSQVVSQEANNLATALKGNNKLQGNWGEMILESLLSNSGLMVGREYFIQEFIRDSAGNIIKDENGKALQPDVTICYPDGRKIIIDSKVSLVAWDACIACNDKEQQQHFLQQHIRSVRQHVDGLSKKNYPKYSFALDYVLLFIPIEPAFLEAVKSDTQLWKYAYEKKILLVSPTNLFAVMKIIADLWKVEQQNANAIEIANRAGALYDKFVDFVDNMESVGKKLEDATDCYTEAFKQLTTGRGNIVGRIQELKKMGAKATKQLPDKLLNDISEPLVNNDSPA